MGGRLGVREIELRCWRPDLEGQFWEIGDGNGLQSEEEQASVKLKYLRPKLHYTLKKTINGHPTQHKLRHRHFTRFFIGS